MTLGGKGSPPFFVNMQQTARTEFSQALKAIAQERGLDPNVILDTIKQAIIAAYKRDASILLITMQ
jgi:hypothetical protein